MSNRRRLGRAFFERETIAVARDLLGAWLVTEIDGKRTGGRIVEVEAYGDETDLASHAARLKSGGVAAMAGPAGIAYVYRSYGIHAMFNLVAKRPGAAGAVLVRAIEPLEGREVMRERRGVDLDRLLCAGPGRLCQAMGIRLDLHGLDCVTDARIVIEPGEPPALIWAGERIGISRGREWPWRYFDPSSPFVSVHRRGAPLAGQ